MQIGQTSFVNAHVVCNFFRQLNTYFIVQAQGTSAQWLCFFRSQHVSEVWVSFCWHQIIHHMRLICLFKQKPLLCIVCDNNSITICDERSQESRQKIAGYIWHYSLHTTVLISYHDLLSLLNIGDTIQTVDPCELTVNINVSTTLAT